MRNTLQKTKKIMSQYQIKANKRFGQNFLVDDDVLSNIVEGAEITDKDLVIEIGPGLGNLTEYLLKKAKYVLLVEIDHHMIDILHHRFVNFDNYQLLNADILQINLDEYVRQIEQKLNFEFEHVKVVANLPYYITTPIIFKLLQEESRVEEIVVMVQKEVADRMVAKSKSKDYGILTLMVEYLSVAKELLIVPNDSFIPAPNVTSAVICLKKEKRFTVSDEEILFELIHKSFANRRKKMLNSLQMNHFRNLDKIQLEEVFESCKIDKMVRAEELDLSQYINLVEKIKEL